jgi:hypothetical protein
MSVVAHAAEEKARGEQPGRFRSLAAAAVAGMAVAAVVYRLLRSTL